MAIITREALQKCAELGKRRTRTIALPELGPDAEVVVRGYTIAEEASIMQSAWTTMADGTRVHDAKQDKLLSILFALQEPEVTLADTEWIQNLPAGAGDRIIATAVELSLITQTAYDQLKSALASNPLVRRIYRICVNKLGRLPSELDVPESEFMTALAALELDAEEQMAEMENS